MNAVLSEEDYVYDNGGNLTSKTVDSVTTSYTYDDIDQLLTESRFRTGPSHPVLDQTKDVDAILMPGSTRREREIQEQILINALGGKGVLGNKRNPVDPKFWEEYGIPKVSKFPGTY